MSESNVLIPTVAQVEERMQKYSTSKVMDIVSRAADALRKTERLPVSVRIEKMYLYPEERVTVIEMFREQGWACSINCYSDRMRGGNSVTVTIAKLGDYNGRIL